MSDWSTKTIPNLLHELNTDLERGLSASEAATRLSHQGENQIFQKSHAQQTTFHLLTHQFIDFRTLLCLGVMILLILPGLILPGPFPSDLLLSAILVGGVFVVQFGLQFYQTLNTRSSIQQIWSAAEVQVPVMRDGVPVWLPPASIVTGDLLLLDEGDYVAADARMVETDGMVVDESPLFGRSVFSTKVAEELETPSVTEQKNMVLGGTYIIQGQGRAVVVRTGEQLQMNRPNQKSNPELESEAEVSGSILTKNLSWLGFLLLVATLIIYWSLGRWRQLSLSTLGSIFGILFVAVPKDLDHLIRTALSRLGRQLLDGGISVRHPINIERLSGLTGLCTQQIGNFTQPEITVSHLVADGQYLDRPTWESEFSSSNSEPSNINIPLTFPWLIWAANRCVNESQNWRSGIQMDLPTIFPWIDDSLHKTLQTSAQRYEIDLEGHDSAYLKVAEVPPSSQQPYFSLLLKTAHDAESSNMSGLAATNESDSEPVFLQLAFGSLDNILHASDNVQINDTSIRMNADQKLYISELSRQFMDSSLGLAQPERTLGFAFQTFARRPTLGELHVDLTFLGGVAFRQPNYPEARSAVDECLSSGMKIVMMSEQEANRAAEVAYELDLICDFNSVTTGQELETFGADYYDSVVELLLVYSRPSADQRRSIVQHLKRHGYNIGFWGQTNEDLRATRTANVSFAIADSVPHLLQRNAGVVVNQPGFHVVFKSLLQARESYANLKNWVRWYLSCTTAQLVTFVVGLGLFCFNPDRFPLILDLPQLVWINLLVGVIPSLAIAQDTIYSNLQKNKPQKILPFLEQRGYSDFIVRGIIISLITLVSYAAALGRSHTIGSPIQTVTCTTLILAQLISNFQCRRHKWSTLPETIKSNPWLLVAILFCCVLQGFSIYLPGIQEALGFVPITSEWQWIIPLSILMFLPLNLSNK